MRGWLQAYNAQAACNEQYLILAADVMTASPDFGHLEQMNAITGDGIPVLIPPDSSRRKNTNTRPAGPAAPMTSCARCSRPRAAASSTSNVRSRSSRSSATPNHNRGFTRFARRGRSAAGTEWRLIATTHNLVKFHQHFNAAVN